MKINDQVSSEERETTKTGGDIEVAEEKTAVESPQDKTEAKTSEDGVGEASTRSMTPTEIAQKAHYEKEAVKNKSIAKLFLTIKYCVWIITVIIGILATWGASQFGYYLKSISEPMGVLKKSVENIEKTNEELKDRIRAVENKLSETREEFIFKNKQGK